MLSWIHTIRSSNCHVKQIGVLLFQLQPNFTILFQTGLLLLYLDCFVKCHGRAPLGKHQGYNSSRREGGEEWPLSGKVLPRITLSNGSGQSPWSGFLLTPVFTLRVICIYMYILFLDSREGPPFTTKLDQLSGGVLGLISSQGYILCCRFDL